MLAPPSPNVQDQEVGLPVEASVKARVWFTVDAAVDTVKAAAGVDEPDVLDEADPPPPPPQPRSAKDTRKMNDSNDIFFPDMIDLL